MFASHIVDQGDVLHWSAHCSFFVVQSIGALEFEDAGCSVAFAFGGQFAKAVHARGQLLPRS